MTIFNLLVAISGVAFAAAFSIELPPGVPRTIEEFRERHPLQRRDEHSSRKSFEIKASQNDTDDVSDEFIKGLQMANHGGTLLLEKGKTYVIAKPLDLTFLDDIHIQWEGEVKVRLLVRNALLWILN
jgi:galacturan 1,4-alpha-galacturonidase